MNLNSVLSHRYKLTIDGPFNYILRAGAWRLMAQAGAAKFEAVLPRTQIFESRWSPACGSAWVSSCPRPRHLVGIGDSFWRLDHRNLRLVWPH